MSYHNHYQYENYGFDTSWHHTNQPLVHQGYYPGYNEQAYTAGPSSLSHGFTTYYVHQPNTDKTVAEKLCNVCYDHATGYHFNALTCEGCKDFF